MGGLPWALHLIAFEYAGCRVKRRACESALVEVVARADPYQCQSRRLHHHLVIEAASMHVMHVSASLHKVRLEAAVAKLLSGLGALDVIDIDTAIATLGGRIYADLERAGRPIGRADPLVAAAALFFMTATSSPGTSLTSRRSKIVGYPLVIDNWREPAVG